MSEQQFNKEEDHFGLAKEYKYALVIRVTDQDNKFVQFIKLKNIGFGKALLLQQLK